MVFDRLVDKIGFVGQGWIGKNYADDFERRGFKVVRYGLEKEFRLNKGKIKRCKVVFVAVPTPTNKGKFSLAVVKSVLGLVAKGTIVVIKSTILPGSTENLQKMFGGIVVLHSPEFLREANAADDAAHPGRNIIGVPKKGKRFLEAAKMVMSILPKSPYELICGSREAELIKYAGNYFLYLKVVFANVFYDLVNEVDGDWKVVAEAVGVDPRITPSHLLVVGKDGGRGAGGHCFIKDFEALRQMHKRLVGDSEGAKLLKSVVETNIKYLSLTGKDVDLLRGVYSDKYLVKYLEKRG